MGFGTAPQAASASRSATVSSSWPASADGSFHQCFNAQAVVDAEHQAIVAADLNDCASDTANLIALTEQAHSNTGVAPVQVLADAVYCSADNLKDTAALTAAHGTQFFIATGRRSHDEPAPPPQRGRIPADFTAKQQMARKLRTKPGAAAYARRKVIVEPVFGQMATLQNAKQLLLRGLDGEDGRR